MARRAGSRGATIMRGWRQRLVEADVECSAIVSANTIPGASVVVFRDPDNIQLELISTA